MWSSDPESDQDIPDYQLYIGTEAQVQLLNDDPDLSVRVIITNRH